MNISELLWESLPAFLINVVWQAAVILGIALSVERVVRRHATTRHAVLLGGLISTLALPAVLLVEQRLGLELVSLPTTAVENTPELRFAFIEADPALDGQVLALETPAEAEADWSFSAKSMPGIELVTTALSLIWVSGSTVFLIRVLTAWCALRRLHSTARPACSPRLKSALQMVRRLRPGALPSLRVSDQVPAPLSAGLVRPYVILPEFALRSQSPAELCDVLLHELAHVRRRDIAVVCLQRMATVLFWPIPLLHRLNRLLEEAREDICDNYVIAVADTVAYSRTLLEFGRRAVPCRAACLATCLLSNARTLEQRICGLLDEERRPLTQLRWPAAIMIAASFTALVGCLGALQLPAQAADPTHDALSILNRGIEALNGEDALKKLSAASWTFTAKAHGPDGVASISGQCYRQGGDQFRRESHFELDTVRADSIEVINRSEGWVKGREGQVVAIADEADFGQTKVNRLYLQWITTLLALRGKAYKISPAAELKIGDHQTRGILVRRDGYSDVVLYFDQQTGLLVKSEMPIQVTSGPDNELGKVFVQETYYNGYQETGGVRYASKITTCLDGKLRNQVEISNLKTHDKLDEALFAKP